MQNPLRVPGTILLVLSVFSLVCLVLILAGNVLLLAGFLPQTLRDTAFDGAVRTGSVAFSLAIQGFVLYAVTHIRRLESYGMALTGAVLSAMPCLSSQCFFLGVPFGIWAFVLLTKPAVKDLFGKNQSLNSQT
jgi:hypothetical protein